MDFCTAVKIVRLPERFGDNAGSLAFGVHAANRAREVVGRDRQKTDVRGLGFDGIHARLRAVLRVEHLVLLIVDRKVGRGR